MFFSKHRDGNATWPWSVHIDPVDGRMGTIVYFQTEDEADEYIRKHQQGTK